MIDPLAAIAYLIVGILATIGGVFCGVWVFRVVRLWWDTARKLNATLHEAVEILKMYRADFAILRQVQQQVQEASPNFGPTPAEPTSQQPIYPFPPPPFTLFEQRQDKPEPDAEPLDIRQVDVTMTEEEIMDAEKIERMAEAGYGRPDPEFKPRAVEVQSE
jgi:hypothetical protein